MKGYIKSSPYFFRLIKISMGLFVAGILILAAIMPAPLQGPADVGRVPNPVKSAWFLLWIQELVSYSKYLVYPVVLLALGYLVLPWLPGCAGTERAGWLRKEQRIVDVITLLVFIAILVLTIVAMFFRGGNWAFVSPF